MPLPPGLYCPTVTFFLPTRAQELDIPAHKRHVQFLARAGMDGVVVQGSTAEAVALTPEERKILVRTAKEALSELEFGSPVLVIAGTVGAQSTQEAIRLARDAAESGADYVLALPPSYYSAAMSPEAILGFYHELADESPIPVIIYSYPGVSSGLQMDSDLLLRIAKHPNVHGVKHTDHDVGRMARMVRVKDQCEPFTVLAGASENLLGSTAHGVEGAITGMTNLAPRVCLKAFELARAGRYDEARVWAVEISRAEWALIRGNVVGTKYATIWANGYPPENALCRRPLPPCPTSTREHVEAECKDIVVMERQLEKEGYTGPSLRLRANGNGDGHNKA